MSEITKEDAYLRFNKELMRRVRVVEIGRAHV